MELALPLSSHRAAELGGVTIDHDGLFFAKPNVPIPKPRKKTPTTAKNSNNTGDASRLAL
ncbi:hypothetical protein X759_30320 [Mesorhizobium sp. LSHC420B00]|nr:hypothetical protein X759_30320 [Mesorhizobium sp. LSHC420B00]